MINSVLKRLFISLTTLICILVITFLLLHLTPGGPFDQERVLPLEIENNLYEKYNLTKRGDLSFSNWFLKDLKSYFSYLAKGKLGPSLKYKDRDVADVITEAFFPSFNLGLLSLITSFLCGIGLALLAAAKHKNKLSWISSLFISLPTFVIAVFLVLIFSLKLKILPPGLWEGPRYFILPVLTLSLGPAAYIFEITLASLQNQNNSDYIRTAKAKGVSNFKILFKHNLKNAATPILTLLGPLAAYLITGSFIVETIFSIPGLGRHFIWAVIDRDYFLVMGVTSVYATILILMNWLVDVGYLILDPRLKK